MYQPCLYKKSTSIASGIFDKKHKLQSVAKLNEFLANNT